MVQQLGDGSRALLEQGQAWVGSRPLAPLFPAGLADPGAGAGSGWGSKWARRGSQRSSSLLHPYGPNTVANNKVFAREDQERQERIDAAQLNPGPLCISNVDRVEQPKKGNNFQGRGNKKQEFQHAIAIVMEVDTVKEMDGLIKDLEREWSGYCKEKTYKKAMTDIRVARETIEQKERKEDKAEMMFLEKG